jgi:hypothetical protein
MCLGFVSVESVVYGVMFICDCNVTTGAPRAATVQNMLGCLVVAHLGRKQRELFGDVKVFYEYNMAWSLRLPCCRSSPTVSLF